MEKAAEITNPPHLNGSELNGQGAVTSVEENNNERHTEEIQDIITKVPSWVIRWGIIVFFCVLLIVVSISSIVSYPDALKVQIKFEPLQPNLTIAATQTGSINNVLVVQGALVKPGQALAIIYPALGKPDSVFAANIGKVGFIGLIQKNTKVNAGQKLFTIHPVNQHFFGVVEIPAAAVMKVKVGQKVLINTPHISPETDFQLNGKITYIADEPDQRGLFTVKVTLLDLSDKTTTQLKYWVPADAQIITQNLSVTQRIWNSVIKKIE